MTGPMQPSGAAEARALCGAKTRGGGTCANPPMHGQARCRMHGGATPVARAAAARRQQEAELQQAVTTFGARRDVTPEEGLIEQLQWTAGHVEWLLQQVQALSPEALIWGRTSEVSKEATEFPGVDTTREAAPNMWLSLYERFQKHYLALIDLALKHKLDERRMRLAERDGREVATAIRDILVALGHDVTDPALLQIVSQRLREIPGTRTAVAA